MGSVVASSQAESYLHTLSNDRSSRHGLMGLWSTCLSALQTRGLTVNVTCKKVMVWGGGEEIEQAKEWFVVVSICSGVWTTKELISIFWFNVGDNITIVEALNVPVGHLINSLITTGHGKPSLLKSGYQRYRCCLPYSCLANAAP